MRPRPTAQRVISRTQPARVGLALLAAAAISSGCGRDPAADPPVQGTAASPTQPGAGGEALPKAEDVVIRSPDGLPRPPFQFSTDDEALLDEVQRGAFMYLWEPGCPVTGMVFDRSSKDVISVAGVGFQLSAIPIGVERGWITREQGEERTVRILRALLANDQNRRAGLFYHYLDPETAGPSTAGYEVVVSTIDSALLLAGVLVAGSAFDGEVRRLSDELFAAADWSAFVSGDEAKPHERGYISLGWKPADPTQPTGPGELLPYYWIDSGDEHRLVAFLGACAPNSDHRPNPAMYFRLRRQLGTYGDIGPMVWFPWSGALFTAFFAHCWIDYSAMGVDDPSAAGIPRRPSVDWWENSRRHIQMHRQKARENPQALPTLGEHAWGLTAGDAATGYSVPGLFPEPMRTAGAIPELDYAPVSVKDSWGDGTLSPYGAGSSIMFEPAAAVSALRYYRGLEGPDGTPLVWRDPSVPGQYGFLDAFNLAGPWVAPDYVAIDQGPLLLAIENARTGLVWRLFHEHPAVQGGMDRLGLVRER